MKKLLSLLLIVVIATAITACSKHEHEWKEATCTSPKTCKTCSETEGEALGHDYADATCNKPKTCTRCDSTYGDPLGHHMAAASYTKPSWCTRCEYTEGEKLTRPSEWGFYNLEEMGNALIRIYGYELTDPENSYVMLDSKENNDAYKFENGYIYEWYFDINDNTCTFGIPTDPYFYNIIDNNNLTSNWYSLHIEERKTSSQRQNFVCFVDYKNPSLFRPDEWYVPYSLIDWDRAPVKDEHSELGTIYKLYLISQE